VPVVSTLLIVGAIAAASIATAAIVASTVKAPEIDTEALDASRQVQRQLDRALPREIVVGTTMTGGVGAFNDAYGNNNEFGVAITVLSTVPITSFDTLVVDGDRMTISGDPTTGFRNISSHFLGRDNVPRLQCRVWLGDDNTALGQWLTTNFFQKFSPNDMYKGCAVLVTIAQNTNDDIDDEGENSIPFQSFPTVQAIVQGVEVCDPRNGGVYGDTTTYAFSDNAGLVEAQLDYGFYGGVNSDELLVGNGFAVGLLDLTQIGDTADYCVTRGYTCSGRIRSAAQADLTELRKCFNGVRVQSPAGVKTIPQGARSGAVIIDMALYPYAHVSEANRQGFSADVYNKARTLYREPDELYGNKDLPIFTRQEWVDEDNGVPRELDIELKFVPNSEQAYKLQKELICISRSAGSASVTDLPSEFASDRKLPNGALVLLQNARPAWLNNTIFTVESKRRGSSFDVDITLKEYAGDETFEELAPGEMPTLVNSPVTTRVWTGRTSSTFNGANGSIVREVDGVISVSDISIADRGSTTSELDALHGNMNAVETSGGGFAIMYNPTAAWYYGSVTGASSSVTTNAVTPTISGGTGTYSTYLWEHVSGAAFVPNSPNSASTTFTVTLPSNRSLTAQMSLTVTDSAGVSTTKNISVTATDSSIYSGFYF